MVEEADSNGSMSALAILTCKPNSHPFQERHIALHEPNKIGRSVARARPGPNNGIFDCKVLSRNHAMLWYENGTFYLQDTKSSNGTFVNDQRLCKGGEESPPREIYSGDLIQFGVNVMENNRRGEKITHGCIIALITLFHPDGREAKPVLFNTPTPGITIQSQELYKLAQCLQEALHREKMLEQKLSTLQELVQNTQESAEGGWQALIDEDRLLSRLETLENQLHAYSKNHTEDTLRQELVTLQEEKLNYETTAKESLMKVLQEKIEAVTKLSDLERSLTRSEDECGHMKDHCERLQEELQLLAEKYQDQLKAVQDLQIQLNDAETKHLEEIERVEKDRLDLTDRLNMMIKQEELLQNKIQSLEAKNELSTEQLSEIQSKIDRYNDQNEDNNIHNMKSLESDSENDVISSVIIPTTMDKDKDESPEDVESKLKDTQQQIDEYKAKLEESEKKLQQSVEKVSELQRELERSRLESLQFAAKISALEDKLKLSDMHMNQMLENTMADLTLQMSESTKQSTSSNDLMEDLKSQILDLEHQLAFHKIPQPDRMERMDATLVYSSLDAVDASTIRARPSIEDSELENELHDTRKEKESLEQSNSALKSDLSTAQESITEKLSLIAELQELLKNAEDTTKEVEKQIQDLKDRLQDEQKLSKHNQEELVNLKGSLEVEQNKLRTTMGTLEETKRELEKEKFQHGETKNSLTETKHQLSESQQATKLKQNEATQLQNKLDRLRVRGSPDLDRLKLRGSPENVEIRSRSVRDSPDRRMGGQLRYSCHVGDLTPSRLPISKRQANEFLALKEECSGLKKRIQAIEGEMKMSRKENLQLSSEYNKLQDSYRELEALKDRLQDKETRWMSNLTDSQKETESTKAEVRLQADSDTVFYRQQLLKSQEEITLLKQRCEECDKEITRLKSELKRMSGDYGRIAGRSKLISFVSCIPLLMLLFAILLAMYPTLETLTATPT
ncbi:sarcolemmal membrane-associated protein-like isoform X3 [Dreissena polymorpha]|uniref:sarcolemmal membrane-associated protein-like isoform X3 n=1 Tax=Dreissena polymorpha TaxID=45954 RepID=UPI0022642A52|nr:sarcolemmal membrane-associated protein-like isoform X3 [Dreissena polymorpha]